MDDLLVRCVFFSHKDQLLGLSTDAHLSLVLSADCRKVKGQVKECPIPYFWGSIYPWFPVDVHWKINRLEYIGLLLDNFGILFLSEIVVPCHPAITKCEMPHGSIGSLHWLSPPL